MEITVINAFGPLNSEGLLLPCPIRCKGFLWIYLCWVGKKKINMNIL